MRVLISWASIAGPVLAYWLARYGFEVTVVERAAALRKTGGHAVDLIGPAMEISERMDVLPRIESRATGTRRMTVYRDGNRRPAHIDLTKIYRATSDRHVEIMRDDLSEIYYDAGVSGAEYLFGDSITRISPAGEVAFERAASRRFDVVVGADGLHSNAFAAYQNQLLESVIASRAFARGAAKTIVPASQAAVWAVTRGARLVSLLPATLIRAVAKRNTKGVRLYDAMPVPEQFDAPAKRRGGP